MADILLAMKSLYFHAFSILVLKFSIFFKESNTKPFKCSYSELQDPFSCKNVIPCLIIGRPNSMRSKQGMQLKQQEKKSYGSLDIRSGVFNSFGFKEDCKIHLLISNQITVLIISVAMTQY